MELHTIYCSARDRNVRVAFEWLPDEVAGSEIDPASGVCIDYCSRECTGAMCSLFDLPPSEMLARLREGDLLPEGVSCRGVGLEVNGHEGDRPEGGPEENRLAGRTGEGELETQSNRRTS